MSLLFESIRLEDGVLCNLEFHNERMMRSVYKVFGKKSDIDLRSIISIPSFARSGLFKCRIEYDTIIGEPEFIPYSIRTIRSLKIITSDYIDYSFKFTDRTALNDLYLLKEDCDDILIVKNGRITDSSFANIIFQRSDKKWVTPSKPLLRGTRISSLVAAGIVSEVNIYLPEMRNYIAARLVNAMMGMDDCPDIPVGSIY